MDSRPYRTGDEVKIGELFEVTYKRKFSAAGWKWRFLRNPCKPTQNPPVQLMIEGEKVIGHYAVSPTNLRCNGKRILSGLSVTTMTHPEFEGKGIFRKLASDLYQSLRADSGIDCVWGFPNLNSHRTFISGLNWRDIAVVPMLSRKLNNFPIDTLKSVNSNQIDTIQTFSESNLQVIEKITASYPVMVERSTEYLSWRYLENPVSRYYAISDANGNFIVYKTYKNSGDKSSLQIDIAEFFVSNDAELITNFLATLKDRHPNGITQINLWLPLSDPRRMTLEKLKFYQSEPLNYLSACQLSASSTPIFDQHSWYLALGDSDVF